MSRLSDSNPSTRKYCYPQCRDPWFNECADCWKSGGNPATDKPKPPPDSNPCTKSRTLRDAAPQGGSAVAGRSVRSLSDRNPCTRLGVAASPVSGPPSGLHPQQRTTR